MKKTLKKLLFPKPIASSMQYLLLIFLAASLIRCQFTLLDRTEEFISELGILAIPPTNIIFEKENLIATNGDSGTLTAIILPTNYNVGKITWNSSKSNVLFVNSPNGEYQAFLPGETIVTATVTDLGNSFSANITVTVLQSSTNIKIDTNDFFDYVGNMGILTATTLPTNHTDSNVLWFSANTNVLTIGASNGRYTAVSVGTSLVFAQIGNVSNSITVTVLSHATNITINSTNLTVISGSSGLLTASVLPTNHADGDVSWTSSDSNMLSIDRTNAISGYYSTRGGGTAIVTASLDRVSTNISVTVFKPATNIIIDQADFVISNGRSGNLSATALPLDHNNLIILEKFRSF